MNVLRNRPIILQSVAALAAIALAIGTIIGLKAGYGYLEDQHQATKWQNEEIRILNKANGHQLDQINDLVLENRELVARVSALETTNRSQVNVGTLADRLSGLDQEVDSLKVSYELNVPRTGTQNQVGTYAYSVDNWAAYIAKIEIAKKALVRGDTAKAQDKTQEALSDLGIYCRSRVMPVVYLPVELVDLVREDFRFETVPTDTSKRLTNWDESWRVSLNIGC